MTISELIKKLEWAKFLYGDIPVQCLSDSLDDDQFDIETVGRYEDVNASRGGPKCIVLSERVLKNCI